MTKEVKETAAKKPWAPAKCPRDCIYRGREYQPGIAGCNYLAMTDKIRGCDPGRDCTCYESTRGRKRKFGVLQGREPSARHTKWDTERGFVMWLTGCSDREIAGALGISMSAVGERRRRYWTRGRA